MPTDMPLGLPFTVDKWGPSSRHRRHRFLTHAHKDHLAGAGAGGGGTVYATRLTLAIALRHFPKLESWELVEMEVGRTMEVDDPTCAFSVTAYDANHCPGAVMFLFEGQFGTILHTGDCRLTSDCVQNLPMKYIVKKGNENVYRLDFVFLDCTFSKCYLELPSKESAIQQVIECIWKHPHAPFVYLACDLLGHEDILVEVSRTFGLKIYVDRKLDCFKVLSLTASEIITDDPSSRFQMVGFHQFYDKASRMLEVARASLQPEPLFIRTSTRWYEIRARRGQKPSLTEAEQDEFGIWHICFSIHSSRDELEQALQLLQPQWVISTTPPLFATELNYVKNQYCFKRNGVSISLSHALGMHIFFRVQIFLDGIPEHARTPDIIERVIGYKCVLQCINMDLGQHLDTRHIELWAWAPDPRDIPRRVWLIFTHQPSDESSSVVVSPPERWPQQGLRYEVFIHIATLEDYSEASYNLEEAMARPDSYRPVHRTYTWWYGVVDGRLTLPSQERTARPRHAADARRGRDHPNSARHENDREEDDGRRRSNWSGCKDSFGWPPHRGEDDEDDYEHLGRGGHHWQLNREYRRERSRSTRRSNWSGCKDGFGRPPHYAEDDEDDYEHPGRGGHQRQHRRDYRRECSRLTRRRPLADGYYGGYRKATLAACGTAIHVLRPGLCAVCGRRRPSTRQHGALRHVGTRGWRIISPAPALERAQRNLWRKLSISDGEYFSVEVILQDFVNTFRGPLAENTIGAMTARFDLNDDDADSLNVEALLQHAGDAIHDLRTEIETGPGQLEAVSMLHAALDGNGKLHVFPCIMHYCY